MPHWLSNVNYARLSLWALLVILGSKQVEAAQNSGRQLQRLQTLLSRVASISAQFTQKKISKVFTEPQVAHGKIYIEPPTKLRWDYQRPYRMTMSVADQTVTLHYPDLQKTQQMRLDSDPTIKVVFDTIVFLVNAQKNLVEKYFDVQISEDKTHHVIVLHPLRSKARESSVAKKSPPQPIGVGRFLQVIEARFEKKTGALMWVKLVAADGDVTEISLSHVVVSIQK